MDGVNLDPGFICDTEFSLSVLGRAGFLAASAGPVVGELFPGPSAWLLQSLV